MTTHNTSMNHTEKLASSIYLIKKAEMDVGNTALTGSALGALLLSLLGRRAGATMRGYRGPNTPPVKLLGNPFVRPQTRYQDMMAKSMAIEGGILGAAAGGAGGGSLAALSNALNYNKD